MRSVFKVSAASVTEAVNAELRDRIPRCAAGRAGNLEEAVEKAMFPGGKRIRPILTLLAAGMVTEDPAPALIPAAALEFLHASSLIFDDLPCMDDAGRRRNQPALHLEFGEATAILAGLALLNQAYEILSAWPDLLRVAVTAIGVDGMIGGQAADLCSGAAEIRNQKTAGLMRLTMVAGPMVCNAAGEQIAALSRCGDLLGEAYQVLDDLRDISPLGVLGDKTPGQDKRNHRTSNYADLGFEGCKARLAMLLANAGNDIQQCFADGAPRDALLQTLGKVYGHPLA